MTSSKTYQELLQLVNAINVLSNDQEHASSNTKGVKKLQSIGTKIKPYLEKYNEKLEDIRLDNAHTEENGCLILDEKGGYKYSKEGLKKMNKDIRILLESEFSFDTFNFSSDGIENYGFLQGWIDGLDFPEMQFENVEETPVVTI